MKAPLVVALLASSLSLPASAEAVTTVTLSYSGRALIYDGELTAAANRRLFALYDAATVKPATLVISSAGGHFAHGLELGTWLHRQPLHLHVPSYCNSACANYVFTAAKSRELGDYAIVAFHGGMTDTADRRAQLQAQLAPGSPATAQARLERYLRDGQQRETRFFRDIGVDQRITSYAYQAPYRTALARYPSWTYSLAMLAQFGVRDIRVSSGERWFPRPARHGLLLIEAPGRFGCIAPSMAIDRLLDCAGAS